MRGLNDTVDDAAAVVAEQRVCKLFFGFDAVRERHAGFADVWFVLFVRVAAAGAVKMIFFCKILAAAVVFVGVAGVVNFGGVQ